ncbi:MAG TPA: chemotaxis protein CheA [Deltaproteobacteria bacterium]|nr:chemotaxis protein CheA [Deltaproteobacteria bacterium]
MAIDELIQVFVEESEEEIRELEAGLIRLEEDTEDEATINRVFRAAHTIKGSAGLVGFESVSIFTHIIENILDRIRDHELPITKNLISTLLSAVDLLKRLISTSVEGRESDVAEIEAMITSMKRYVTPHKERDPMPEGMQRGYGDGRVRTYSVSMKFRPDILSTGQDPLMLIRELADLGDIIERKAFPNAVPDLYTISPTRCYTSWDLIIKTASPLSELRRVFIFVQNDNEISLEDISSQYKDGIDLSLADKPIGEILVEKGIVKARDVEEALRDHKTTGQALVERGKAKKELVEKMVLAQSESRKAAKSATIRVDTDKLDTLVNLVGEMVISVARLSQLASEVSEESCGRGIQNATSSLERISRDLQEQVMRVRMVPVEGTFNRFRRIVRDMSFELGKKIEIKMSGTETELDKNVIEQISDPLKHMIRNAIDHGIERPEERRMAGKPEVGVIWLKAYQREGNILIEISDDGKGIDKNKILEKALEKGLAEPDRNYSDKELFDLLFIPGLSTAEKVSELSGRGVGMDVVRKNIEDLRGSVEISSEVGIGSTFTVQLPLTLAIIDGMMVRVGSEILTIPLSVIDKSVRPTKAEVKTVEGKGELIDIRGDYIPLARLNNLFHMPSEKHDPTDALVIVLQGMETRFGILVDDVLGQTQAVIKSLDKNFRKIEGTSGATILGNGKVSLIVDVHGLESMAFGG